MRLSEIIGQLHQPLNVVREGRKATLYYNDGVILSCPINEFREAVKPYILWFGHQFKVLETVACYELSQQDDIDTTNILKDYPFEVNQLVADYLKDTQKAYKIYKMNLNPLLPIF